MKRSIILTLGLALSLSSCVLSKKYSRTDPDAPEQYRNNIAVTADTVQLPWRTFFSDPQLVALIDRALTKNNDINIALKNVDQLNLAYRQARLGLLPAVDGVVSASRLWPSRNSLNGSLTEQFIGTKYLDDYAATLRLSWEADIWGKVRMQKDAARASYFAQRQNFAALQTRIISQVAQSYYNLLALDQQLALANRNIALSDTTLRAVQLQYNSGQVTSLAVEQSKAQRKTAELLLPLAKQNIAVQENALSILCGEYPDAIARAELLLQLSPDTMLASAVPAQLLSRRPDVMAAEYAVVAANARTGLAKAAMYPSISITPQIGVNSYRFNNWFDLPGSLTKTLAANLTQPIFNRRALRTAYRTAVLEQEKAVLQFRQTMLQAVGEVSDAMAQVQGTRERIALALERTASLEKATRDANLLYRSGMATYLEVITAQSNKLQNDLEAVNIRLEQLNATTNLYRALGGGVI